MAIISVIIPCYNAAGYIDRCLGSVVRQTVGIDALEIICVDDASDDDTPAKLGQWEEKYPGQFLLVRCAHNGRQGTARNIGLGYASCEWIAFIDADDWLEPDYLSKLYQAVTETGSQICVCQMERDASPGLPLPPHRDGARQAHSLLIDTEEKRIGLILFNPMKNSACARLIHRPLLLDNRILFPEQLAYEDTYWGSLLHLYAGHISFADEKLYHYSVNPHSTVLTENTDYHLDLLTVQSMLWKEWRDRGFYAKYREALEYDYLHSCYFAFLKILAYRYRQPSYSAYLLLKELIREKIPGWKNNAYLRSLRLPPLYRILLEALELPMNREDFRQFIQNIRTIGL